ncbi:CPBP family glutamic-type intramembrane protease [Natronorarus salvus]|uniref:CPBP family glutamic-type intramembrane protease n=1 Tax=Natronorarus salvus TaxID=3117733 RepID=UPI002F266790
MGTVLVVAWIATALVVFVVVRATARHLDQRPFVKYGFRISREWWADLIAGIVLGSLTIVMTFLVSYRFGWLILPEGGLMIGSVSPVWLSAFFIGFIAVAFWEELVFRGVFMINGIEGLTERGHSRVPAALFALIGSSVVFALINVPGAVSEGHSAWFTALWTLSAGLLWGVAYLLTGELALPIGLHLGFNYVSSNVFGINGVAELEGVPTVFVVESTTTGLTAPMSGIPIIVSNVFGIVLVICWCYWRGGSLTFSLGTLQPRTDSQPAL